MKKALHSTARCKENETEQKENETIFKRFTQLYELQDQAKKNEKNVVGNV